MVLPFNTIQFSILFLILGDFSILIQSGMSKGKAILFNLLSASTCLIGLFVGIALGADEKIRTYLIALTAGMFIYIALTDMVSATSMLVMAMSRSQSHETCLLQKLSHIAETVVCRDLLVINIVLMITQCANCTDNT